MTSLVPAFITRITEDYHVARRAISTKAMLAECGMLSTTVRFTLDLRKRSRLRDRGSGRTESRSFCNRR